MYILTEGSTMWPKRHHWCWDIGKKGTVGQCFYFPWMYFQTTCTPELDFSVPILCIVSTFLKGNSNPERNKNVGFANLQGVYLIHTVKYGGKSLKFHCPNVYKKEPSCCYDIKILWQKNWNFSEHGQVFLLWGLFGLSKSKA